MHTEGCDVLNAYRAMYEYRKNKQAFSLMKKLKELCSFISHVFRSNQAKKK